ncbi:MAG TPA: methyltransferase domain-containing protein [archaeon]|nr:methyltransferase domain-containing protein [archaeon]
MHLITDGHQQWLARKGRKAATPRGFVDPAKPPEGFHSFPASFTDRVAAFKRGPQLMHQRDIGQLVVLTGLGPGWQVAEGGSGMGHLTSWLAYLTGPKGHVYSYENRQEHQELAKANFSSLDLPGLAPVTFKLGDVFQAGDDHPGRLDLLFYDLPNPWDGVSGAAKALKPGGWWACYLPSMAQVTQWLDSLNAGDTPAWFDPRIVQTLQLDWKPDQRTLRPESIGVTHTAFLCLARHL